MPKLNSWSAEEQARQKHAWRARPRYPTIRVNDAVMGATFLAPTYLISSPSPAMTSPTNVPRQNRGYERCYCGLIHETSASFTTGVEKSKCSALVHGSRTASILPIVMTLPPVSKHMVARGTLCCGVGSLFNDETATPTIERYPTDACSVRSTREPAETEPGALSTELSQHWCREWDSNPRLPAYRRSNRSLHHWPLKQSTHLSLRARIRSSAYFEFHFCEG